MGRRIYWFYVVVVALGAAAVISLPRSAALRGRYEQLATRADLPAAAMVLCLAASIWMLLSAWRASVGELALLGTAMTAVSGFGVMQGLATPGLAYAPEIVKAGPQLGFSAGAAALPAAALALTPVLLGTSSPGRALGRRWKAWSVLTLAVLGAASVFASLATPAWLPSGLTVSVGVLEALGAISAAAFIARLLRLHAIGGDRRYEVTAISVAAIALAHLASGYTTAGSGSWWAGWGLDLLGFAAVVAAGVSLARDAGNITAALGVALSYDPLSVLEVCAAREVSDFVEALSTREPYAHDHALRVGELAARVACRAGMPPRRVRDAGIAGALHDFASIVADNGFTSTATSASSHEPSEATLRAELSATILRGSPVLASVADIVRYQHERFDASGALRSDVTVRLATSLPFEAFVVAACDAWDAMVNDRSYRDGIGPDRARQALLDGSGFQWHPEAVRLVLEEVAAAEPSRSSGTGSPRNGAYLKNVTPAHFGSVCPDALAQPKEVGSRRNAAHTEASEDFYYDPYDDELHPRLDQLSELLRSQKRFRTAFEQAPIGMLIVDSEGKVQSCNGAFETLLGFDDPAAGTTALDLVSAKDRRNALRWVASLRRRPDYVYSCDLRLEHRKSGTIPVHVAGSVIEEDDRSLFYLVHVVDLSERQRMELELRRQAFVDPLTGLLNRRGLLAAGPELIRRNQLQGQLTTGIFIDLDGLKSINDTLGHESGDQAIVDVATVIASAFPTGSLFARLGGDEMYVLTSLPAPDPDALSSALRRRLAEHATSKGRPYKLSASAGASTFRGANDSIANLIDRSDQDLYARRRVERNPANRRNRATSDGETTLRQPAMSAPEITR